jgi:hypothetical protein
VIDDLLVVGEALISKDRISSVNRRAGPASSRSILPGSARAESSCSRARRVFGTNGSSISSTTRLSGYSWSAADSSVVRMTRSSSW